jgi:hypothetical protein
MHTGLNRRLGVRVMPAMPIETPVFRVCIFMIALMYRWCQDGALKWTVTTSSPVLLSSKKRDRHVPFDTTKPRKLMRHCEIISYPSSILSVLCYVCSSLNERSWDSVVGIATGYWLVHWGVGVRVPVGSRIFCSPQCSDRLWDPPRLLSSGYRE